MIIGLAKPRLNKALKKIQLITETMAKQDIKFEIRGLKEVQQMLKNLPQTVNEKVLYDLHRGAAKIVKQELENAAPDGNNDKKSINKAKNNVAIGRQKGSKTGVMIGFRKRSFGIMFYEKGTKIRTTKGKGKYKVKANRGRIIKKPFIIQAHERAYPKAVKYVTDNYLKIVNRSIKKQLRRITK